VHSSGLVAEPLSQRHVRSGAAILEAAGEDAHTIDLLPRAADAAGTEYRGTVVMRHGEVVGVAIHGLVAGASGAGRLVSVGMLDSNVHDALPLLLSEVEARLRAMDARFVLFESRAHRGDSPLGSALIGAGYEPLAQVSDYFADGAPLVFHRLALTYGDSAD
jgi:hypothetical protein